MTKQLSEAEATLYDRQIRLWGVAAQERLRHAHALMVGMGVLNCDVAKNIVLAGIGHVTVAAHGTVSKEHVGTNMFVRPGDVGHGMADVCARSLLELNPMAKVNSLPLSASNIVAELAPSISKREYDVIVMDMGGNGPMGIAVADAIDECAREHNSCFILGELHGVCGRAFFDVGTDYKYVADKVDSDSDRGKEQGKGKGKGKKRGRIDDSVSVSVEESVKSEIEEISSESESDKQDADPTLSVSSPPLKTSRNASLSSVPKRIVDMFMAFNALDWFNEMNGRPADSSDLSALEEHLSSVSVTLSANIMANVKQVWKESGQIVAVAGVVGGVIGGEVIKMATRKIAPLRNYFFFDAMKRGGTVDYIE